MASAKFDSLLAQFAKDLRAKGTPLMQATMEACHMRFRPILMTGLAFVCGVLPMAIASGAGARSQQALGTSVMGGMIAVVILALLMVPVFFVAVTKFFSISMYRRTFIDFLESNVCAFSWKWCALL